MEFIKFSVTEIRNTAAQEPSHFTGDVDVSDLASEENNDIRKIGNVHVNGLYTVDGEEIIFSFTITGKMILPCARTLVDVPYPFSIKATEIFSTSQYLDEEDEKDGVHQVLEEMLDLTPYIKENIILETPYRVFSDEKPIEKGSGWELYQEDKMKEEKEASIDPRLAKLQQLLHHDREDKK